MDSKYRIELDENSKGSMAMNSYNNLSSLDTVIKVIGVGNGGCNAINRMIAEGLENVDFIAMNTDAQALSRSNAPTRIVLGDRVTQGLGAGTDPEKGAEAAREDVAKIEEIVSGANLVFIASSFGGGTGTGASPVVAEAAKKAGALTIGVVTKPFEYEGRLKMERAEAGIEKMLTVVDSLIIIPNENLYDMVDMDNYKYEEALAVVDDILRQGVQGISDIITQVGFINVDFADVKTMISLSNGRAHLGIGVGKGDDRLHKAITNAFENPLLDVASIKNARGILANIVCPKDFGMKEYREASKIINNYANENANIKIGVCTKEDIKDEIIVTIVATGFDNNSNNSDDKKIEDKESNTIKDDKVNDVSNEVKNANIENNSNNVQETQKSDFVADVVDIEEKANVDIEVNRENLDEIKSSKMDAIIGNYIKNIKKSDNNIEEEIENNNDISNNKYVINFKNKIEEMKKPVIVKSGFSRLNLENELKSNNLDINLSSDNILRDDDVAEEYEEELEHSKMSSKEEAKDYRPMAAVELNSVLEDEVNTEIKAISPFEIMPEEEMQKHNNLGAKLPFADESVDTDYEKPAFLRRQLQVRNINR
ncbi:cell division protein FtsZ [Brachyspira pilosicoli WesB]|uniref:Cell division protein FtsZ n=1 Tax=Brachyspira pilosicoli WesB TaxID=1161918 RepID=K0JLK0_BRAPL|nr:cell division protein FtsZ [Brachyspira pilosicoli]PLV58523.1 cell division protein FtsZ [Brachyspira pilosicoli SP16]CCG57315.1 cell division protein FtsZ [Brachyspira pilosicoli WesB]